MSDIVLKPLVRVPCAIIERNGRVLAAQRSAGGSLPMKWEFPGGKLEADETEEEGLIREIREELCVEIRIGEKLPVTDRDDIWRTIRLVPFVCELTSEEIILTEHEQILWLSPGELPELDWAEADRDVLANYFKYLDDKRSQPKLRLTRRQPQPFSIFPGKTT
ncbi:(deoxy)nucleoside triphosphate pyrophosphohydrolase [Persicitalea jodogahamensis]|uniref:(deoxy)nucleoside triphosphate pyrophosphohydrolase n=1 Tax=Persicitalea jodogahamensis TaxID=402147 RepID=UPI001E456030|nr:(deoxy)nucleoside triphosphate pyrophosphohydrolase [Persicitalea jodogahamensis]